jgi:hypothetical protein
MVRAGTHKRAEVLVRRTGIEPEPEAHPQLGFGDLVSRAEAGREWLRRVRLAHDMVSE